MEEVKNEQDFKAEIEKECNKKSNSKKILLQENQSMTCCLR